ncbi:hypothetical protein FQN54_000477 [Arachnomyces sp. PD_36]|nr:hypothetical protein FQN54_000477 [Arachnomyces sp. PD_36]
MAREDGEDAPQYLPAKSLPFELRQQCRIYFEEELYTQALNLLLNIISSGTVTSSPVFVPSPQHLALVATLIVHPSTTTRAKTTEHLQVANSALQLLRITNKVVGPSSAEFGTAFTFTHLDSSRYGGRQRAENHAQAATSAQDFDSEPLNIGIARAGSLWNRAEDFWHAVGWSFNCSVLHPKRWRRWQLWLQLMCEVLEDDWEERMRVASAGDVLETKHLKDSLIFRYIYGTGAYGSNRRILRAIFADGGSVAVKQFGEVFRNELKELKKENDQPKKREVDVNIEEDIYGDYMDRDEEDSDAVGGGADNLHPRPKRPRKSGTSTPGDIEATPFDSQPPYDASYLGGFESLALRQRLLQLLSTVSASLQDDFIRIPDLYSLMIEFIRPLPIPTFQLFVTTSTLPYFVPEAQATLCETLLMRMLSNRVPTTQQDSYLTQPKLEEHFLPYSANTTSVVDNAKVSILLESLLESLAANDMLENTVELRSAIEFGITARGEKAQSASTKAQAGKSAPDEWAWLIESGERMMHRVEKLSPLDDSGEPFNPGE